MYNSKTLQRIPMLLGISLLLVACSTGVIRQDESDRLTSRVHSSVNQEREKSQWLNDTIESMGYESYPVIEVDGGDQSGEREPNVAVNVGFGEREYWAFTNEYGQLVTVIAEYIVPQNEETEEVLENGRYYHDEAKVPGTEAKDLDEGHVIADSLGGVSNAYNITPQQSVLNRHGDQAYMEDVIRKAKGCKYFIATITYPDTQTQIPDAYTYEYMVNGNSVTDHFPNMDPEAEESTLDRKYSNKKDSYDAQDIESLVKQIDTNHNGMITIKEAETAGFEMPITSQDWLYPYMRDTNQDGIIGE